MDGATRNEVEDRFPLVVARYERFLTRVRMRARPKLLSSPRDVILLVGPPGTGKTRFVWDLLTNKCKKPFYAYPASGGSSPWFDGYDGEQNILLDEFQGRRSGWRLDFYLKIVDSYPQLVPVKGSFVWWNPRSILITSNLYPWQWWDYGDRPVKAVERRFTRVVFFKDLHSSPVEITDTDLWKQPEATSVSRNLVNRQYEENTSF